MTAFIHQALTSEHATRTSKHTTATQWAVLLGLLALTLAPNAFATRFPAHPINATTTVGPTSWSTGRFAPRVWTTLPQSRGRVDVLNIGMDAQDGPTTRPPPFVGNFYNIQGREITFPSVQAAGVTVAGSLYIPTPWNTVNLASSAPNRRSELLLQLTPLANDGDCPGGGSECFYYAAIGFSNAQIADQLAGGGTPRIRILKKGVDDGWINLTSPFASDAWNDMCISFTGSTLEYFLNGNLVFTDTTLVAADPTAGPPTRLRSVTMESYNFGSTFDAQWADLEYGARASLALTRSAASTAPNSGVFSITTTVRNNGSTAATNVQVVEPANTGMTLLSVSGACTALPCLLGTLAAGDVRTYTSSYQVAFGANTVSSVATVRTDGIDCTKSDNTGTITAAVGAPFSVPTLNIFAALALMLALLGIGARTFRANA
jgi:uncharacterized repeat protein (TIGR01451 family)